MPASFQISQRVSLLFVSVEGSRQYIQQEIPQRSLPHHSDIVLLIFFALWNVNVENSFRALGV
jgi:hypothetical protein